MNLTFVSSDAVSIKYGTHVQSKSLDDCTRVISANYSDVLEIAQSSRNCKDYPMSDIFAISSVQKMSV